MTKEQKLNAIAQMKSHCQLKIESNDYESVSARGILYTLGFTAEETDETIELIRLGGFTNCLDNSVFVIDMVTGKKNFPDQQVCYWGPDQLLSRLQCLFIR